MDRGTEYCGRVDKHDFQLFLAINHCWAAEHLHSAIRFVTPNMRHGGKVRDALANRAILYANARAQKPERWSGKTRNWQPAGAVWLIPERGTGASEIRDAA
jgi:putative transposase